MVLVEITALPPKVTVTADEKKFAGNAIELASGSEVRVVAAARTISSTWITLLGLDGSRGQFFSESSVYFDNSKIGDLLSNMIACGQEGNVIARWYVPDDYMLVTGNNGKYDPTSSDITTQGIAFIQNKVTPNNFTFAPKITCYCNKTRYGQSATITVFNPASGQQLTKNIYDLIPYNDTEKADPGAASWVLYGMVGADIRPDGCPVFAWKYNDGGVSQLSKPVEYIKGAPWMQLRTTAPGVSGALFKGLELGMEQENVAKAGRQGIYSSFLGGFSTGSMTLGNTGSQIGQAIAGGAGSGMTNAIGAGGAMLAVGQAAGNIAQGSLSAWNNMSLTNQKIQDQLSLLSVEGKAAVSTLTIPNSDYMRDTGHNKFYFCVSRYDAEDTSNFDSFLTKFGYNVGNYRIGTQMFWCRKYFVFIKVNDIQIASAHAGFELLEKVKLQLKVGMRIWRQPVNYNRLMPQGGNNTEYPDDLPVLKEES